MRDTEEAFEFGGGERDVGGLDVAVSVTDQDGVVRETSAAEIGEHGDRAEMADNLTLVDGDIAEREGITESLAVAKFLAEVFREEQDRVKGVVSGGVVRVEPSGDFLTVFE